MLHRKPHIENHLKSAEKRLAEHLEQLNANGMEAAKIPRNSQVKNLKATIRQAKKQLAAIAAIETQMATKAEDRIRKEAAKAAEPASKPKKKDRSAPPAKKRKKPRLEAEAAEQAA